MQQMNPRYLNENCEQTPETVIKS